MNTKYMGASKQKPRLSLVVTGTSPLIARALRQRDRAINPHRVARRNVLVLNGRERALRTSRRWAG
jgi:hypothetical protein